MHKPSHLHFHKLMVIVPLLYFSCTSVPHVEKQQYHGAISELSEKVFYISNNEELLRKKIDYTFTNNGRIKTSKIFDINNDLIVFKEKKLWFVKQSYPDKEPYYCKTRWKTKNRERISCYTQKRYKENESIHYYLNDGRIDKIEDNFKSFNTQKYHYNDQDELISISINDKQGVLIDSILVKCNSKDRFNNCIELEKRFTISDSILIIKRDITYTTN